MQVNDEWNKWIAENLQRGCTQQSMIEEMVKKGFDAAYAQQAITTVRSKASQTARVIQSPTSTSPLADKPAKYVYDAPKVGRGNFVYPDGTPVDVVMRMDKPEIVVFANVLSKEECELLIERAKPKMQRSTTINNESGAREVIANRTSQGCFFKPKEDIFIANIEARIASIMQWPEENGEGLQVLNYQIGGEYKPHFDYFPPKNPGSTQHIQKHGQRVSTFIVYLNDVPEGGETGFPSAGVSVAAKQGNAVYFRYMNAQGQLDPLSLHAGCPVKEGEKWIITKWMRERPYTA
jgi:prolyl 4-hydroxylase